VAAARRIASCLSALGHDALTSHLLRDDVEEAESAVGDGEVFARVLAWLESCGVLIAEASGSSYGVGFEIGYVTGRARATGQRVCVFYDAAVPNRVSAVVTGYHGAFGEAVGYASLDDLDAMVRERFSGSRPAATVNPG
jgi:hypothetical protein